MNRYSKEQSALIFKIFASFVNDISEEQFESLLNGTSKLALAPKQEETTNEQTKNILKQEHTTKIDKANKELDEILSKLKSSDRKEANDILLDESITKDICFDILDSLNLKVPRICRKETLVKKILDSMFPNDSSKYEDLVNKLKSIKTREQARLILVDSKLKVTELKQLASIMDISLVEKTKDRMIQSIIQSIIEDKPDTKLS